jgi:hypothetical protein
MASTLRFAVHKTGKHLYASYYIKTVIFKSLCDILLLSFSKSVTQSVRSQNPHFHFKNMQDSSFILHWMENLKVADCLEYSVIERMITLI